jgi:tRNA(fMet)-specific endonuclease VapC
MEAGLVLDTDVLVANLRGKSSSLKDFEGKNLATTVVNAFELFHGAYKSKQSLQNLSATRGLLASLELLGLDIKAAERAGETLSQLQKSGEAIEIRDILVGCIAREKGYSVLTFNVRHFRRILGLQVVDAADARRT